jgi:predicted dehydrogenase
MSAPVRLGIIGCGNVSLRHHLPALIAEPGVALAAAADPTPARLAQLAAAGGLGAGDCLAEADDLLARDDIDAVLVATPQAFRPDIVRAALAAGKHVLSEKPLALTPADGWTLARQARAAGRTLALVHNYRFMPDCRAVKRVLDEGAIGEPYLVTLNFLGVEDHPGAPEYAPAWRHDPRSSGGGVLMDMLHAVYVAAWLFGRPAQSVSAAIDRRRSGEGLVEDVALCRFAFEPGFAQINMAWGDGPGGIEIMGSRGRLLLFYQGFRTSPFAPPAALHVFDERGPVPVEADLRFSLGMDGVVRDFVQAIADGREPQATAEEGCATLEAVLGAYASAVLGREVALPLAPDDPVYQRGAAGLRELPRAPTSRAARLGLFGL